MFSVRHVVTGQLQTVYGVNGTMFLLWYSEKETWYYDEMVNYRPYEVTG